MPTPRDLKTGDFLFLALCPSMCQQCLKILPAPLKAGSCLSYGPATSSSATTSAPCLSRNIKYVNNACASSHTNIQGNSQSFMPYMCLIIERFRIIFTAAGKRQFVLQNKVFFTCPLPDGYISQNLLSSFWPGSFIRIILHSFYLFISKFEEPST